MCAPSYITWSTPQHWGNLISVKLGVGRKCVRLQLLMNLSLAPAISCCPIPSNARLSWDFLHSLTPNEVYKICSTWLPSGTFSPSGFFLYVFAVDIFIVFADLHISASKPTSAWHVTSCKPGFLTVLLLFLFSCKFLRLFLHFPFSKFQVKFPIRSWYLCVKSERSSMLHLCITL